jgi:hypothetical protein
MSAAVILTPTPLAPCNAAPIWPSGVHSILESGHSSLESHHSNLESHHSSVELSHSNLESGQSSCMPAIHSVMRRGPITPVEAGRGLGRLRTPANLTSADELGGQI